MKDPAVAPGLKEMSVHGSHALCERNGVSIVAACSRSTRLRHHVESNVQAR
eukprot:m.31389 g.31389  ORF g.31389 m.31389 type:complete len:51 (-) comp6924_c0_seq1:4825-4977(-)